MTSLTRTPLIDSLKAIAAQLIVLHHLAFYGPLSDVVYDQSPVVIDWLYDYARMAVQIFIVIAGFLAALALTPARTRRRIEPLKELTRRYMRLVPPYAGALLIAMVAAAIARTLMQDDSIPAVPSIRQFLAHVFLLNDVLGEEALSAGAWYVAIDFQLFIMLIACVWFAQHFIPHVASYFNPRIKTYRPAVRHSLVLKILVGSVALVSLLYVNRFAEWDSWGVYFFGAYALGVMAYWAANARSAGWMLVPLAWGLMALMVEPRLRIGVATVTAVTLCLAHRYRHLASGPPHRYIQKLGQSSYSLFLLHFPVCLIVNAVVNSIAPGEFWPSLAGLFVAWGLSNACGMLYHLYVERNAGVWLAQLSTGIRLFVQTRHDSAAAASLARDLKAGPLAVRFLSGKSAEKHPIRTIHTSFNPDQGRF